VCRADPGERVIDLAQHARRAFEGPRALDADPSIHNDLWLTTSSNKTSRWQKLYSGQLLTRRPFWASISLMPRADPLMSE
jgi:hypothetical protein